MFAHGRVLSRLVLIFKSLLYVTMFQILYLALRLESQAQKFPLPLVLEKSLLGDLESKQIIIRVPAENTTKREYLGL